MTNQPTAALAPDQGSLPQTPHLPPSLVTSKHLLATDDDDVRNVAISLNLTGETFAAAHERFETRATARVAVAVAETRIALAAAVSRKNYLQAAIDSLVKQDEQAQALREKIGFLDRELVRQLHQRDVALHDLRLARFAAEQAAFDEEIARLDIQERESLDRLATERLAAYESAKANWERAKAARDREVDALNAVRDQLAAELDRRLDRVRSLDDSMVSRTVANFLVWVGYAAAAIAGVSISELLARGTSTPGATLAAAFAAWMSLARQYLHPLALIPVATSAILGGLASIGAVAWVADRAVAKFEPKWEKGSDGRQLHVAIPSLYITRSSYAQLVAALPFAYTLGLFLALISINPVPSSNGQPTSPVDINQVVGAVIGFPAAGIFILYLTRIIEPRLRRREGASRRWYHAWEIALLPLILVSALVAVTAVGPGVGVQWRWGALAVLMTSAMLTLAYGIVLRGLFRDVDYAETHLRRCSKEISRLTDELPPSRPNKAEKKERARIAQDMERNRNRLADLARRHRVSSALGAKSSQGSFSITAWLGRRLDARTQPASVQEPSNLRQILASPTDTNVPPAIVARHQACNESVCDTEHEIRRCQTDLERLGSDVDRSARVAAMREECAALAGRISAAEAEESKQRELTNVATAEEQERFIRAWHLADVLRPRFDLARGSIKG